MENQETFRIEDLKDASWALRKIREYKESILEKEELAKAEKERIDKWLVNETKNYLINIEYFNGLLIEYYKELKQSDPKAKISTPYGKVAARKTKKWNYKNENEFLEYLTSNGYNNLVRVKKEIDKTKIKKEFIPKDDVVINKNTGEILPFIDVVEEETINVKVED